MKLYFKNSGSGSLLIRVGTQKFTIKAGVNTVPDDVGEEILKKNIKGIHADEDAKVARGEKVAALSEVAALKAEIAELKTQIAKLQLIAAQVPSEIDATSDVSADKPRRGRPAKTVASE